MNPKSPFASFRNRKILLRTVIACLSITITSLNLKAQPAKTSVHDLFTQGSMMMSENYNDSALKTFLVAYKLDSTNANICYYIGQLYLRTSVLKANALPYLEKASKNIVSKYKPDDPYEKNAPPPTYYYLARAQHLNYQFDAAIANFTKFQGMLPKNDDRQKDISYWINCCNNGKELMKSPVDCKIVNLGDSINTTYPEYSPIVSADEQEILFTRRGSKGDTDKDANGNYYEHIWISYAKHDRTWGTPEMLGQTINSGGNVATVSLSPDGQRLILYQDNASGDGNLYVSYLRGTQWSGIAAIDTANPGSINSPSWEPSACVSPDQKTVYFSSNRAGGLGGLDIYRTDLVNGKWSFPVNLGPAVNSEYDEDAPFIHFDDSTMFFSSKGHNSMGGFDVFSATENASGQWGNVTNIGYPINTPDDDIYFNVSADGRRAYYTSVRSGGYGEKDIWEAFLNKPLPVQPVAILVGYIKSPDGSRLPNDLTVSATPANSTNTVTTSVNPLTGKFLQVMRPNQNYNVSVTTQGKTVFNHNFFLSADSSYATLSRAFFRTAMILGDTTNVFSPKKKTIPVATTTKATGTMSGRLLLNDDPIEPLSSVSLQLVDGNGKVAQTTITRSDGSFTFDNLVNDATNYTLVVDTKDTKLKKLKKLLLANSNGEVIRSFDVNKKKSYYYNNLPVDLNSISGKKPAVTQVTQQTTNTNPSNPSDAAFVRYFGYNLDDVSPNDEGFGSMIDKLAKGLSGGGVNITIEASASTVPTKIFHSSNKNLAAKRAKRAKEAITEALKKKQADISKLTIEINSSVQGPDYEHDAKTDESKYHKYQYVKVFIH